MRWSPNFYKLKIFIIMVTVDFYMRRRVLSEYLQLKRCVVECGNGRGSPENIPNITVFHKLVLVDCMNILLKNCNSNWLHCSLHINSWLPENKCFVSLSASMAEPHHFTILLSLVSYTCHLIFHYLLPHPQNNTTRHISLI